MFNHSPSDRMQVRELGNLQPPGTCSVCGNGTDILGYFDPDVWIEYYGQVYLCMSNCAKQAIEVIGGLIPEEAEHLKEISTKIAEDYATLKEKYDATIARLDVYDTAMLDAAISAGIMPVTEPVEPSTDGTPNDPAKPADDGESEPEESVTGPGPNDLALFERSDEGQFTI